MDGTRAWVRGEIRIGAARKLAVAAHAAAREDADPAVRAAARAAGQAAGTAHMGGHARHAANYAVAAVRHANVVDRNAAAREREWQYRQIPEAVRSFAFPKGFSSPMRR